MGNCSSTPQPPTVTIDCSTTAITIKSKVDVVIENAGGQLIGVEIKAAASVGTNDLRGLKRLASIAGDQFKLGVILYDGTETLPLGERLWAAPISTLWGQ